MTHIYIVHPSLRLTFADFRQTSCGAPRWTAAWFARIASASIWPPGGAFSKSSSQSDLVVEHFLGIAPCFMFIIYFIHVFVRRKIYNDSSWFNVTSPFSVSYMKEVRRSNTKLQIHVVVAALKAIVCRTRCVFFYGGSYANGRILTCCLVSIL